MISTKGRYALRVMIDLAQQDAGRCVPLEEIATRQGISKKYLELIIKILVRENLLKGMRGKGGGYRLTRRPEEYTVWEICLLYTSNIVLNRFDPITALMIIARIREGNDKIISEKRIITLSTTPPA